MLGTVTSCALSGIDAFAVEVEVDVASGNLPSYHVVGLPATSVREGGVRIRSALERCGQQLPSKKITVNLAPGDRRKDGAAFDLPIALALLVAHEAVDRELLNDYLIIGELGLDGDVRAVRGALSAALLARSLGKRGLLLPASVAPEAAVVDELDVIGVRSLSELIAWTRGELELGATAPPRLECGFQTGPDLADVRGQETARMAIEVAVAGGHNLLLVGPPGIGKTMLARRIPSILPPLTREEAIETTRIHSVAGISDGALVSRRPFRAPHHSISAPALIGGGRPPTPGEVSLAHNGVLFLDELPEFSRDALEALRQPLEDREVSVVRVSGAVTLPASILLAASANPCPCGWHGSRERECTCSPGAVERYRSRLSGPLLDRIDMQIFVPNIGLASLRSPCPSESSAAVQSRVLEARARQARRLARYGLRTNAEMGARATRETCPLGAEAERTLERLHQVRRGMTARTVDRIIRVSRTVADLTGADEIDAGSLLEAAGYRTLDTDPLVDPRTLLSGRPATRS